MAETVTLTANDGSSVEFEDTIIASGAMKDVYFSPDKSYVVAFFRNKPDDASMDRIHNIIGPYREKIFNGETGAYWDGIFCWPRKIVERDGKIGLVMPVYDKRFFFKDGMFQGKEKIGKWFCSAKLCNKFLGAADQGTWFSMLHCCIKLARGVERLHKAGLSHSDLSYNNVLIDPLTESVNIIDCDGLVVPGKYHPDVVGTPDFIAPEVLETNSLPRNDPAKVLPSRHTDCHALAVLIYMLLLKRHPLRGRKVHDSSDSARDEELSMGAKALFIEHPQDHSNRPDCKQLSETELPQGDPDRMPYTLCGPYLKELFDRAFIDGLHDPSKRPSAGDWLKALVKTTDLVQPCTNSECQAKWFVFDNTIKPKCPFCGAEYHGVLPILNLYYSPRPGKFVPENYRLMVYHKQCLYMWHVNKFVFPNENLKAEDRKPVGDFYFDGKRWLLINRTLPDMFDVSLKKPIAVNSFVELREGKQIMLGKGEGARLIVVQMVRN